MMTRNEALSYLKLSGTPSISEIRKSYLAQAKIVHPDMNPALSAEFFKKLGEAKEFLIEDFNSSNTNEGNKYKESNHEQHGASNCTSSEHSQYYSSDEPTRQTNNPSSSESYSFNENIMNEQKKTWALFLLISSIYLGVIITFIYVTILRRFYGLFFFGLIAIPCLYSVSTLVLKTVSNNVLDMLANLQIVLTLLPHAILCTIWIVGFASEGTFRGFLAVIGSVLIAIATGAGPFQVAKRVKNRLDSN